MRERVRCEGDSNGLIKQDESNNGKKGDMP